MFSLSHGAAWSMTAYPGKPFAGMMNQAPTKANYYYIDCRGSNSLRPFIKFYGATRHGVSNLGFSSSPGAAMQHENSILETPGTAYDVKWEK